MTETPAQSFGRAGSIEIIILFTAFIAATYGFGIYLFASLIPEMRTEIGFDYAAVGLMTAAAQGGFLVFALISGLFASVIGARKAIIFSVFLCAACLVLMPFAGNSLIVGVLLALMAAAAASVWIPMVAVCKELIPAKHQGKAFGLISSGTAYGVFINGLAVPLLMPSYGWKSIWLVLGLATLGLALWAMLRIGLRDQPAQSGTPAKPMTLGSRLRVLGRPEALAILLMMFLNGLSCMPAQNYLSAMMREELGYSVGSAALAWSIIGFVGMFSGLAIGALADRISIRWAMVVTYALALHFSGILSQPCIACRHLCRCRCIRPGILRHLRPRARLYQHHFLARRSDIGFRHRQCAFGAWRHGRKLFCRPLPRIHRLFRNDILDCLGRSHCNAWF